LKGFLQLNIISAILLLFFLLHAATSLICIFFVSCQLVLLSAVPKFLHSFCGKKKGCTGCSSEKLHLDGD
jgi:hypothetical protein